MFISKSCSYKLLWPKTTVTGKINRFSLPSVFTVIFCINPTILTRAITDECSLNPCFVKGKRTNQNFEKGNNS